MRLAEVWKQRAVSERLALRRILVVAGIVAEVLGGGGNVAGKREVGVVMSLLRWEGRSEYLLERPD
jgi:hypothetical protein